ncbi:MAG: hypothetical protein LH679_22130 [Cyanobacteria bacterium CAN_BIN43]|nr:hypothetical protein [Cyanobacteria bacterium CAN_BIN43]
MTGEELENFFKDFAKQAGILELKVSTLEDVVRLFEAKLPYKFAKAERFVKDDYPSASEWFDKILNRRSLPLIREDIKEKLTNRLLDLVIATDAVVKIRGNDGIERKIAIDVTANFTKEQEKVDKIRGISGSLSRPVNHNQNLPQVREALGIEKHIILVMNNMTDNLPSFEKLLTEIYAFANVQSKTRVLDLRELSNEQKLDWKTDVEEDPQRLWRLCSQSLTSKIPLERSIEVVNRAIGRGFPRDVILKMLVLDPEYKRLVNKNKGDRINADKYAGLVYTRAIDKLCLAQATNSIQQKINLEGLRCSEFVVKAVGRDNSSGERVFQVSNGWMFRQRGEDLTLDTVSDRGIILEFKNRSLKGILTFTDLERLKKCVRGLQQVMQEQKNKEFNFEL